MSWMIIGYRWDSEEPIMKWTAKTNREVIGLMKTAVDNMQLDHIDILKVKEQNNNPHAKTGKALKSETPAEPVDARKGCGKIFKRQNIFDKSISIIRTCGEGKNLCPSCKEQTK